MSKVLAKFRMVSCVPDPYGSQGAGACRISFCGSQGEPFGTATPDAQCQMRIDNPVAAKVFLDAAAAHQAEVRRVKEAADRGESEMHFVPEPEFFVTFALDTGRGAE